MSIFWFLYGLATGYAVDALVTDAKREERKRPRFWWSTDVGGITALVYIACMATGLSGGVFGLFGWLISPEKNLVFLLGAGSYYSLVYGLIERPERQKWLRDWIVEKIWPWLKTRPERISERLGGWWRSWRGRRAIERERGGKDIQASFNAQAEKLIREIGDSNLLNPLRSRIVVVTTIEVPRLLKLRAALLTEIPRTEALLSEEQGTKEWQRTRAIFERQTHQLQDVDKALDDLRRSLRFLPPVIGEARLGLITAESTAQRTVTELDDLVEAIHASTQEEMFSALPEGAPPALPDGATAPPAKEAGEGAPPTKAKVGTT